MIGWMLAKKMASGIRVYATRFRHVTVIASENTQRSRPPAACGAPDPSGVSAPGWTALGSIVPTVISCSLPGRGRLVAPLGPAAAPGPPALVRVARFVLAVLRLRPVAGQVQE